MVNTKTIATVAISVVLSLVGALALLGNGPTGPQGPAGKSFGALVSPDIASPFLSWGGVRQWAYSPALGSSKTVCSVQAPAATSTLIHASVVVNSQPTANQFEIGIATTNTATTTRVALKTLSALTDDSLNAVASSTPTAMGTVTTGDTPINIVVGPHQFVNVNVSSSTLPLTHVGHCNVLFREL